MSLIYITTDAYFKKKLRDIKRRATKSNVPVSVDWQYLKEIYPENGSCPVLDIYMRINPYSSDDDSASIDRIDPSKGYIKGNVLWVSMLVNQIMSDAEPETVIKVGKFYKRLINKNRTWFSRIKSLWLTKLKESLE